VVTQAWVARALPAPPLLDSTATAAERAKGKRPMGVNATNINTPRMRAAAQEAMNEPFLGADGPDRGACPCSLLRARSSCPAAALDRLVNYRMDPHAGSVALVLGY
jgi:hypothetical protein